MPDGHPSSEQQTVSILGLGFIGTSLAAALKASGDYIITGWDIHPYATKAAHRAGYIDLHATSLDSAVGHASVVILCMYISGIIDTLSRIRRIVKPDTLIIDVGSVKGIIVDSMNRLPKHVHAIGGHPMAGRITAGVESADARLFENRIFVLTPCERTTEDTLAKAEHIINQIGAKPVIMDATAHDKAVATISHIVRLMPIALAETAGNNDDVWQLAAGAFRDATRPVNEDLGFWRDVAAANPDAIVSALRSFGIQIERLAKMLENGDIDALDALNQHAGVNWKRRFGEEDT